jgi:hypothetical protein
MYADEFSGFLPVPHDDHRVFDAWDEGPFGLMMIPAARIVAMPGPIWTWDVRQRGIFACPSLVPMSAYCSAADQTTYVLNYRNGRYRYHSNIGGPGVSYVFWVKREGICRDEGGQMSDIFNPTGRAQICCSNPNAHQGNVSVMYMDGHARSAGRDRTAAAWWPNAGGAWFVIGRFDVY